MRPSPLLTGLQVADRDRLRGGQLLLSRLDRDGKLLEMREAIRELRANVAARAAVMPLSTGTKFLFLTSFSVATVVATGKEFLGLNGHPWNTWKAKTPACELPQGDSPYRRAVPPKVPPISDGLPSLDAGLGT